MCFQTRLILIYSSQANIKICKNNQNILTSNNNMQIKIIKTCFQIKIICTIIIQEKQWLYPMNQNFHHTPMIHIHLLTKIS